VSKRIVEKGYYSEIDCLIQVGLWIGLPASVDA